MNRRLLIGGGVVFAVLLAVGAVLFYLGGGGGSDSTGLFDRLKRGLTSVSQTMTPTQMAEAPEFASRRLEVDTSKAQPEACLVFTRNPDQSGKTHYEHYLTVDQIGRANV